LVFSLIFTGLATAENRTDPVSQPQKKEKFDRGMAPSNEGEPKNPMQEGSLRTCKKVHHIYLFFGIGWINGWKRMA